MSTTIPPRLAYAHHADEVAELLWSAISAADEYAATELVLRLLDEGTEPESVLLDVIARVQGKVGEEWAANRISVAQEHAATAINERAVAVVSVHPAARTTATRGRITVACVEGEWHGLPARLLSEVLKLRGWRVDYLGAQVPTPHLISHLHNTRADAVALSSSIATRLPTAHAAITACQAIGVPVLVGGSAFGPSGCYAKLLGADAWAPDARAAADRLARGGCRSRSPTTSSSTICRTWPTRNTPWSLAMLLLSYGASSPPWRTLSPRCAPTANSSESAPRKTSRTL